MPTVYVGEGDDVSSRLQQHAINKDFWDRFIVLTSKDPNLTKAHVRYLEAGILKLLRSAKKCSIHNQTSPEFDRLPESDISDMEAYLEQVQLLLPVIGFDLLRLPKVAESSLTFDVEEAVEFTLANANKGINATAREIDGEFVVLAGSVGNLHEGPSFKDKVKLVRDQGLESGTIVKQGSENFRLINNVGFNSPSYGAVFLYGTSRNGRSDWVLRGTNKTYGEWKDDQLKANLLNLT